MRTLNAYTEDHCPRDEKNRDCERIYTHVTSLRLVAIISSNKLEVTAASEVLRAWRPFTIY